MKRINNILNMILVITLAVIIINPVIGGAVFLIKDRRLQRVEENTKEENIRFCNLNFIFFIFPLISYFAMCSSNHRIDSS